MTQQLCLKEYLCSSKRGKPKIVYDGYYHNLESSNNNKIIWRCTNSSCRGVLHTNIEYSLLYIQSHCHDKFRDRISIKSIIYKIFEKAINNKETVRVIILTESINNMENFVRIDINIKTIKKINLIRRTKKISYEPDCVCQKNFILCLIMIYFISMIRVILMKKE